MEQVAKGAGDTDEAATNDAETTGKQMLLENGSIERSWSRAQAHAQARASKLDTCRV